MEADGTTPGGTGASATQNLALLLTQKTSRQQDVTPIEPGRFVNEAVAVADEGRNDESGEGLAWDWSRTRTTSRGVTGVGRQ